MHWTAVLFSLDTALQVWDTGYEAGPALPC